MFRRLVMQSESPLEDIPRPLLGALSRRGFTTLTPIQEAVLAPDLVGRDLRLTSQTGSGKTVAIGLVLARDLDEVEASNTAERVTPETHKGAAPSALLVVPTRELAAQLTKELSWLLGPAGRCCCTITGGVSYPWQMRELRNRPDIVIGTPGRLRDHVERGHIDLSMIRSVVLDEADQMLDMGFREDLEAIVDRTGPGRRLHMASATFPPAAREMAERYQHDPRPVFGGKPGQANDDITHVAHLVRPADRLSALVNVLLLDPSERTLVFVRTRADASNLASRLGEAGFSARPISGDLEQAERTRTLDAFRSGGIKVLVATDVAARGLDIPDVHQVIHADPPGDAEALTHRSGRTGRAGKKGRSLILVTPAEEEVVARKARLAAVELTWQPAPNARDVWKEADARLVSNLEATGDVDDSDEHQRRMHELAQQLVQRHPDPVALVRELLVRAEHAGPSRPREVAAVRPTAAASKGGRRAPSGKPFVPFHINWGTRFGADARRLLALICRWGGIRGDQVGAIRLGETFCTFEVEASVSSDFARRVRRRDPRNPRLRIGLYEPASKSKPARRKASPRGVG